MRFIRFPIPNPLGLAQSRHHNLINEKMEKLGRHSELFSKHLPGELPRIGLKAYLPLKCLLLPNDEYLIKGSGHHHNMVMSPSMWQRKWSPIPK